MVYRPSPFLATRNSEELKDLVARTITNRRVSSSGCPVTARSRPQPEPHACIVKREPQPGCMPLPVITAPTSGVFK